MVRSDSERRGVDLRVVGVGVRQDVAGQKAAESRIQVRISVVVARPGHDQPPLVVGEITAPLRREGDLVITNSVPRGLPLTSEDAAMIPIADPSQP